MDKSIRGPIIWNYLYLLAYNFDKYITVDDLNRAIQGVLYGIPCEECFEHFKGHISKAPIFNNSEDVFNWLLGIRNHIREEQGLEKYTQESFNNYIEDLLKEKLLCK